jgi:hypothetical protein
MHHKRGRPKNRRSGCLLCKPHKMNGWGHLRADLSHANQKREYIARVELNVSHQD